MNKDKVAVAMSGGVDSSVAAAILKEQGFDVTGITMNLFSLPKEFCSDENLKSCCGRGALEDANRVAAKLGIDHFLMDFEEVFAERVIGDFLSEYASGRTPNPCIRCNEFIKFDALLERASRLGVKYLATGHHARVERDADTGRFLLKKGKDRGKDQSYFLYTLTQEQLSRVLFPIGNITKPEVREKAGALGLPVAQRPESQEVCFIPDNNYVRFLKEKMPEAFRRGPIVDVKGNIIGEHDGIVRFTVGQRRGLKISAARPLYVLQIRPEKNEVIIGPNELLYGSELVASSVHFIVQPETIAWPSVMARIRHKHNEAKAEVILLDSRRARVLFEKPQRAITPGQAVVFYEDDLVLGGGTIIEAE